MFVRSFRTRSILRVRLALLLRFLLAVLLGINELWIYLRQKGSNGPLEPGTPIAVSSQHSNTGSPEAAETETQTEFVPDKPTQSHFPSHQRLTIDGHGKTN
jgi:hypothetical protein